MQREIKIFKIAETKVDREEVKHWMECIGADEFEIPDIPDPALLIALAGKRCYMSFEPGLNPNVTKIRSDYSEYFDNILKSGHGSCLEHSCFSFAIEGLTRVASGELNRHRAGWAISEGSLRFIRFDEEIPYWFPLSLRIKADDDDDLRQRKIKSAILFHEAFKHQEKIYGELMDVWNLKEDHHNFSYKKKVTSCLRRIVGMGVSTGGVWTGNVRALRHVIAMRCDPAAEEEIAFVFTRIADMMVESFPLLFGDFDKSEGYYKPKYRKV